MSSRRKTALATVQRSEDPILKIERFDDGVYTECGDSDEEGPPVLEPYCAVPDPDMSAPSPSLPMSPLTPASEGDGGCEEDCDEEEMQMLEEEDSNTPSADDDDEDGEEEGEEQDPEPEELEANEEPEDTDSNLPNAPFKRNYSCGDCDFQTQNPRTHLYHLRDVHGAKAKIYECTHCVYASSHSQKVYRHINKCHQPNTYAPAEPIPPEMSSSRPMPILKPTLALKKREPFQFLKNILLKEKEEKAAAAARHRNDGSVEDDGDVSVEVIDIGKPKTQTGNNTNVSTEAEQGNEDADSSTEGSDEESTTEDSDTKEDGNGRAEEEGGGEGEGEEVMEEEEEEPPGNESQPGSGTGASTTSPFRCTICNYTTRNRSRFTKHVRYHSMPLIKCTYCDFKTPYKWNLDRHYRSHTGEGSLRCPLCNFSADIKQSITVHIQNHHENLTPLRVLELVQSLDVSAASASSSGQPSMSIQLLQGHGQDPNVAQRNGIIIKKVTNAGNPSTIKTITFGTGTAKAAGTSSQIVDRNGKVFVKKFNCKHCNFKAIWESELNRHIRRTHPNVIQNRMALAGSSSSGVKTVSGGSTKKEAGSSLCPNVMYSFDGSSEGADGIAEQQTTNCEYCSEVFGSEEELMFHQNNCVGLAKIQEWNGGLLWGEDGDEAEAGMSLGGKRSADPNAESVTTMKKVYKCPQSGCQFWAITASRFHVHMVGHSNSKPFECSLCSYKSNWRWDIAKHIKLKSMRDSQHLKAEVLLKNESGERNYKDYDQYLMVMKVKHAGDLKLPDCSTKADKRDDIEMEIADDPDVTISDILDEPFPFTKRGTIGNEIKSQHNFLKPTAPRRFIRNNFIAEESGSAIGSSLLGGLLAAGNPKPSTYEGEGDTSLPPKLFKMDVPVSTTAMWKCKKCTFRAESKEAVFVHLRQFHNMKSAQTQRPVSILKSNMPPLLKSEVGGQLNAAGDVNLNSNRASTAGTSKDSHQYLYNDDGGYSCKFCPFSTMQMDSIIDHSEHHFSKVNCSFSCDFCSYSISSQQELDEHIQLHKTEPDPKAETEGTALKPKPLSPITKKYTCGSCPYVTDSRGQFHYHSQFHTERDSLYKCSECSYNVSHKHLLHQHIRVHQNANGSGTNPALKFESSTSNSNPSASASSTPQLLICELCPARFFGIQTLQMHSVFHRRQFPLQCSECSYSVRLQGHLEAHLKLHTPEYQLVTEQIADGLLAASIPQAPAAPAPVATRVRFQEGDDEACEGNPDFSYPTHMKNGKLKEKRYKCKKCPSAFEKRDQYKVHIGLHGSKQRYQCTVCDYAVTFYANFMQHLKKHKAQPGVDQELLIALPISKRGLDAASSKADAASQPGPSTANRSHPPPLQRKPIGFQCQFCNYETRQKNLLEDHLAVMHPNEDADGELVEDNRDVEDESDSNSDVDADADLEGFGEGEGEPALYEEDMEGLDEDLNNFDEDHFGDEGEGEDAETAEDGNEEMEEMEEDDNGVEDEESGVVED